MKTISFAVPSYNSEAYMENCIEQLLTAKDRVEILIVDDGSTDRTAEIADRYQAQYPDTVKAIHQENKGHGGAVNTGMANATGKYFKVVDSDDWLNPIVLQRVLDRLESLPEDVDLFICNYVYDKVGEKHKKVMSYHGILPEDKIITWKEAGHMGIGKYVLMHSVIYRTEMLRESGVQLPEHTFYVDNIFVTAPLPYVRKLYYMNVNLYHYFIGRDDQSVHESVMIKRLDQQLRVNKILVDNQIKYKDCDPHCYEYMYNYLTIITGVSQILLRIKGGKESEEQIAELWDYIKNADADLYRRLHKGVTYILFHIPGFLGKKLPIAVYHIAQKIYGFN